MTVPNANIECVTDLPPSAKLVYVLLESGTESTQADLVARTGMARSSVNAGLELLVECGNVAGKPCLYDARKTLYYVTEPIPDKRNEGAD